ncbi:DNA polymerase III subunit gamma/tau [Pseudidiomarina salilacus]|uniref:DNA polymerase III subunit gamma/tau n=1 Tax=Pseudidiomarina salilacus TaxID=3384452 RepID=UPI0039854706
MSYQVLARKWRPRKFAEVVGQQHVLKPLMNALESGRLHHAWLLTGTRGVGKTTIARILAKSLNCEQGITAEPCGSCGACKAIDEGRFVDLLEIDAASRTKVEDTRELLDNVQYKPTHGRYKVYLIDEVHMLSRHSFNALLKTLEEPPEHVKFLLATTDPQKLPITVLSRCLQFNLKALDRTEISSHLAEVLQAENIAFETNALQALARAARGSMRDALSLTDQAIAQGEQQVTMAGVQQMLGAVPSFELGTLLEQVLTGNGDALLQSLSRIAGHVPDLSQLLGEMQNYVHQLALFQAVPTVAETLDLNAEDQHLAQQLPAELLQVYYDILLQGRRDLHYAADVRSGVEMCLLRMMAFRPKQLTLQERRPAEVTEVSTVAATPKATQAPEPQVPASQLSEAEPQVEAEPQAAPEPAVASSSPTDGLAALLATREQLQQKKNPERQLAKAEPEPALERQAPIGNEGTPVAPAAEAEPQLKTEAVPAVPATAPADSGLQLPEIPAEARSAAEIDKWAAYLDNLQLDGLARQLARNSVLLKTPQGFELAVREAWQHLLNDNGVNAIKQALLEHLQLELQAVYLKNTPQPTPFELQQAIDQQRLRQAEAKLAADPHVQALTQHFGAELIADSVKPL